MMGWGWTPRSLPTLMTLWFYLGSWCGGLRLEWWILEVFSIPNVSVVLFRVMVGVGWVWMGQAERGGGLGSGRDPQKGPKWPQNPPKESRKWRCGIGGGNGLSSAWAEWDKMG